MSRNGMAHSEVVDIALEALALAQGQHRAPSRQDVLDAIHMATVGKRCGKRKQDMLIMYGWAVVLRVWWRKRCVPDWAAGLQQEPAPKPRQDDMGTAGDATACV
jgi:hypothetical protein